MKILVKTKLLEGQYLELREYEMFKDLIKVIHCVSENYKSCYHDKEQIMFLSVAQQRKGKVVNTQQSKYPPYKYYRMYKFLWKPYQKSIDEPVNLFTAMSKMAESPEWEKLRKRFHG